MARIHLGMRSGELVGPCHGDEDYAQPDERLEDDEELKLFIMGEKTLHSKCLDL